jgi:hypothetical protein
LSRVDLKVSNLLAGVYGLYKSGELVHVKEVKSEGVFEVTAEVGAKEVDIVLMRQQQF